MHLMGAGEGAVVVVDGLGKRYGTHEALRDVGFSVEAGSTVAVLGPNGAGKTTLLEILEGFRTADQGHVRVLQRDPATLGAELRELIGVVLQTCQAEPYLSVREIIELHRGYYRDPAKTTELLDIGDLSGLQDRRVRQLSGGELRRLDLALALVGRPKILFLDEPTTGYDPQARMEAWDLIRRLQTGGVTIVLTTHYIEEAEALADRVVVIAAGAVVADATPDELTARRGRRTISFEEVDDVDSSTLPVPISVADRRWTIETAEPTATLATLTSWAWQRGIELADLTVAPVRLEDVYLELVG